MEKNLFVANIKRDPKDVISIHPARTSECTNCAHDPNRLLRLPQVLALIPISKSSWWKWVRDGKAPQPIHLGNRCTCWRYADIIALIE